METSKKTSSQRQLEAGIFHFRKGDLDCAITLSAAAECILPETRDPHLFQALKEHPAYKEMDYNLVINWLKHSGGPDKVVISEFEATLIIARAITKFVAVYHQSTDEFEDFLRWAHEAGHLPPLFRA